MIEGYLQSENVVYIKKEDLIPMKAVYSKRLVSFLLTVTLLISTIPLNLYADIGTQKNGI